SVSHWQARPLSFPTESQESENFRDSLGCKTTAQAQKEWRPHNTRDPGHEADPVTTAVVSLGW
ncbi:mCG1038565, partial [Mus musculus]